MRNYLYKLLYRYISLYVRPEDRLVEVDPPNEIIIKHYPKSAVLQRAETATPLAEDATVKRLAGMDDLNGENPDFVLLNGTLHREGDIQKLLQDIRANTAPATRVVITYYSSLWRPLVSLASALGLRTKTPESNWITHDDITNMLVISDYQFVRCESRVLLPVYIPIVSYLVNRFIAPLPGIRHLCLVNIALARPLHPINEAATAPSVSIVVAARNEEGNIEQIIQRVPKMGPDDELVFVEGGSTDNTWDKIGEMAEKYKDKMPILKIQQDGKGKGDAVRKGFGICTKDILMILDADMTVPPEDLPRFYEAIRTDKGEYINGTRLVYPMEKEAMRFFNIIGNKFFAAAFSFVLGQQFRDTLCGTKVMTRENYEKLAAHRHYFGEFDPFGDFDLIFGCARMGLKIVEVPITYRERTYGDTNISRWSHGVLLLKMLLFAAWRIKFI